MPSFGRDRGRAFGKRRRRSHRLGKKCTCLHNNLSIMKKRKEAKFRIEVTVTPNPNPDYPDHARVEAIVVFPEGKAVFRFAQADITGAVTDFRHLQKRVPCPSRVFCERAGLFDDSGWQPGPRKSSFASVILTTGSVTASLTAAP